MIESTAGIKVIGKQTPVMILTGSQNISRCLQSDLRTLGFKPLLEKYPDLDTYDITKKHPIVILLDLTVCDRDARSVCKRLLNKNILPIETALVALVSENTVRQIPIYKFDDIIKFPYDIVELGFRFHRVIHIYHQESAEGTIRAGSLSISPSKYEVKVNEQPIVLSHTEYELLKYLISNPNHVFTREALLTNIWGYNKVGDGRTVDVHIRRVRAKIGDTDHNYIRTVRGVGYTLRSEGDL